MLDFYDSAVKLNLSFNKQIKLRGWQALFKAVENVCFILLSSKPFIIALYRYLFG